MMIISLKCTVSCVANVACMVFTRMMVISIHSGNGVLCFQCTFFGNYDNDDNIDNWCTVSFRVLE